MANIKISDLTQASVAADANEFEINEAGTSKKVTGAQISALVESNLGLGALATLSAVGTTQITDGSVTNAKLGADAVDGTKLADNAVDSEHITAGAVDTVHIGDAQVTEAKLSSGAGAADQLLTSDGAGNLTWADPAGGAAELVDIKTFTASGTWTANPLATKIAVYVAGGAGGGASHYASTPTAYIYLSGGGGGGVGAAGYDINVSGTSQPVVVGAGGNSYMAPNQNGGANGNAGGQSRFGTLVYGNGGAGGTVSNTQAAGGTGSSNGTRNFSAAGTGGNAGAGNNIGNAGNGGGSGGAGFNRFPGSPTHKPGGDGRNYLLDYAPQAAGEAACIGGRAYAADGADYIWSGARPITIAAGAGRVFVFEYKD